MPARQRSSSAIMKGPCGTLAPGRIGVFGTDAALGPGFQRPYRYPQVLRCVTPLEIFAITIRYSRPHNNAPT